MSEGKKKTTLAERLKAERQEEKKPSMAERMRARREEEEKSTPSMAERLKARRNEEKKTNLVDRMRQRVADARTPVDTPSGITNQIEQALTRHATAMASTTISDEEAETLKATLEAQRKQFQGLISRVKLTDIVRQVTQTGRAIEGFPDAISKLRSRGYVFRSYLEDKVEVLATQWDAVQGKIDEWIEREADALSAELDKAEALFDRIDENPTITVADKRDSIRVGTMMEVLETKVVAAEDQIKAIFDSLKQETDNTTRQIREIEAILTLKDESGVTFNAGENIFLAARAEWVDGGEKPNGILYLSDQRLVFEQKETKGKTLGLFGGKKVQDVLWDAPVTLVEKVESENKGFLGGKDMLYLTFASGAPYAQITVELKGGVSNKLWETQIRRMIRGELESESVSPPDEEFVERLRNTPTACPTCGATLPQITGTPSQIECLYCGTAIRI